MTKRLQVSPLLTVVMIFAGTPAFAGSPPIFRHPDGPGVPTPKQPQVDVPGTTTPTATSSTNARTYYPADAGGGCGNGIVAGDGMCAPASSSTSSGYYGADSKTGCGAGIDAGDGMCQSASSSGGDAASTTATAAGGAEAAADITDPDKVPEMVPCIAAKKSTTLMCNTASLVGIDDPVAGAAAEVAVGQLVSMAANLGKDQAQICKNQKTANTLLAFLSATKAAACEFKIHTCSKSCGEAIDNMKTHLKPGDAQLELYTKATAHATSNIASCNKNQANVIGSALQAGIAGIGIMTSAKCESLASTSPTPIPVATPFVVTATDCSDATVAKTNIVCICQTNPTNPLCGQNLSTLNGTSGVANVAGPASPSASYNPDLTSTDGTAVDTSKIPVDRQKSASSVPGGGGGGPSSAGGGGGGGGDSGDAARKLDEKSVITGLSTGNGGSGGGLYSGGTSGAGRSAGGGGGSDPSSSSFNISKFLPKAGGVSGRDPASTVVGKDGVTGANGLSLFEKVNAQYQNQTSKLIKSP